MLKPVSPSPAPSAEHLAPPVEPEILAWPADFWLVGPPPALLWQNVGTGAMRIAYARPLPQMLS